MEVELFLGKELDDLIFFMLCAAHKNLGGVALFSHIYFHILILSNSVSNMFYSHC